jgi:FkbM family methyltransferase
VTSQPVRRQVGTHADVRRHRGQWLAQAVRCAPAGRHLAFEPIPELCAATTAAFPAVEVRSVALADRPGTERFCRFTAPAYDAFSGLRRRTEIDDRAEWITVQVSRLDDEIGDVAPALIKVDVEGAELAVLRGAGGTLERHRPTVVFEHQPEANALYETTSQDVWDFWESLGSRVYTLQGDGPLGRDEFATRAAAGGVTGSPSRPGNSVRRARN